MINPEETAVAYSRANIRNIQTLNVGEGLHFIQEDQPDAVGQGIADWLRGLEG
jgi:haloalkane dehalogenase